MVRDIAVYFAIFVVKAFAAPYFSFPQNGFPAGRPISRILSRDVYLTDPASLLSNWAGSE